MGANVNRTNWIRKASLLFITFIAVLFVSMYLAPETSATGFQAQYGFNIIAVYGEGQNDVYQPTPGNFNHGQRVSIEISTLNNQPTVGNKVFAFYVVDGSIVTSAANEFTVTSNTKVTAVFTDGEELAAVFVDTNGDFLSIDYVDGLTAPVAPSVAELSKPGFTPVVFGQLDLISEHTVYVVSYVPTNPDAIVVINEVEYPYNAIVTLTAESPFTHWVEDGVIVSYNPTYQFTALSDRTITQTTGGTAQTLVTLSDDLGLRTSEGKSSFLGQFEIADGETFVEAGIIASEVYVNNLTLDTPDVQIIASNAIQPVTNEFLRTVDSDAFAVIRGYVKTSAGVVYSQNQTPQINTGLMIYEVYGGGGNSGAIYKNDYVVLYNGTSLDIDLSNYSLQYASATGEFTNQDVLSGTIAAGKYFVAKLGGGGSIGVDISRVDYTGTLNLSATNGKIALVIGSTQISTTNLYNVVDLVGFGSANLFEGTSATAVLSNSTSAKRNSVVDSNNNSTDFTVGTPDLTYTLDGEFYTVSFDTDEGSLIDSIEVYENNKAIRPAQNPTKEGYIFDNWYTSTDYTTLFDFDTLIDSDITIYANWLIERTVTFVNGETTLLTSIVGDGTKVTRPAGPFIEGYSFVDWYEDEEFITLFDFDILITSNRTIYGRYDVNESQPVFATDLFISEYIEGGGNNKALEIFNGTGVTVDLSIYTLRLYTNGASSPSTTFNLTGSLANGEVLVISSNLATIEFKPNGHITSGVTNFNGNDAIALAKNGANIDVFGVIGVDPGSAWSGNDYTTENRTWVRNSSVTSPTTTWTVNQWGIYSQDTSSYLGSHTFSPE